jgi:hypothetical protein
MNAHAVGRGQFDQLVDELANSLASAPAFRSAVLNYKRVGSIALDELSYRAHGLTILRAANVAHSPVDREVESFEHRVAKAAVIRIDSEDAFPGVM